MVRNIVTLLGMPGAGKGTQGLSLSKELGVPHVSTGEIFRKMILNNDSKDSKLLADYMKSGKLIPTDLVNQIIRQFINSSECKEGCILDGYPRNLSQAEYFSKNIDAKLIAILFDIESDVVVNRILGRISCPSCGKIYNKYFNKPLKDGLCDSCVSELVIRSDDTEVTILSRIKEYEKETLPLIDYYKSNVQFFTVDASRSSDVVLKELVSIIKNV